VQHLKVRVVRPSAGGVAVAVQAGIKTHDRMKRILA
jgi:hypothetical protein